MDRVTGPTLARDLLGLARPPAGLAFAAPPGARLQPTSSAAPPPGPAPAAEEAEPEAPTGWGRRLLKMAGLAGLAVSAAASVVGGIAVQGNLDTLRQAPSLTTTLDAPREAARPPASVASTPVPGTRAVPLSQVQVPADGVSVLVPGATVRGVAEELQDQPALRRVLDRCLGEVKASLERTPLNLPASRGQVLVDLEVPLPTGDRAFLHVGEVDLPSLGLRQLHTEKVPLAVGYQVQPGSARLQVDLQPLEGVTPVRPAGLEGGVPVGALRVRVGLPPEGVPVRGEVRLDLDLDSEHTLEQQKVLRQRLQGARPGSEEARRASEGLQRLAWRMEGAQRLKVLGGESNLDYNRLLRQAFQDQRLAVEARVHTEGKPLVDTVVHVWLGPDVNRDGKADVHLATVTDYSAVDRLQLETREVQSVGQAPEGFLEGRLHDQVGDYFRVAARDLLPRLNGVVRDAATRQLASTLQSKLPQAQAKANADLARLYEKGGHVDLPMPPAVPEAHLELARAQTVGTGEEASLLVHLRSGPSTRGSVPLRMPEGMRLRAGEFAVRVGGAELSRQVADVSQGGSIPWNRFLAEARQKTGLQRLEFGRDERGQTVFPRLVVEQGRLALDFDLVMEPDVAALVRPTLHRGVSIPIEIAARDGRLLLRPEADGVRLTGARTSAPMEPMDLLPTRWIGNLVGNLVADSEGPARLSEALRQVGYPLDLRSQGLEVREVGFVPRSSGLPDVVARLAVTPAAPGALAARLGPTAGR